MPYPQQSDAIAPAVGPEPISIPITHRRALRTTNLLERLFLEERRRLKIIPNAFGEKRS